jgi:ATP:ADP antiporter, AAA family
MPRTNETLNPSARKSLLDRSLSLFTDVRPGEGATVLLMLLNIFLLLVCYSVIKTVREPLILLGGGAEVRSYAAAGQALLLMGFVPLYSWFASRVDRVRLLIGVTLFFIAGIELFAAAVAAQMPFVGVAFFIWVGIFNVSLVAQFWSFANDIYTRDAGARLFPIIVIGMTAGAPLGSFVAGRLFRSGIMPSLILQIAAFLLAVSVFIYLCINRRQKSLSLMDEPALNAGNGFRLVLGNPYLFMVAMLVVILNVVNTTGEYLVARLLTDHVEHMALLDPGFDKQAYIGAFSGGYQFWVNVVALVLQAFVTSRLVRHSGLRGVLLALPLIALGGYTIIAAGVGFSAVRWLKTAENATDYSIMNTARQLLWLPTTREEKYQAKQAIDTFFVRGGDVLSAGVVYVGASIMNLNVEQFATVNIALTIVWLMIAFRILGPQRLFPHISFRPLAGATAAIAFLLVAAAPAVAQTTREEQLAVEKADKAAQLRPYAPDRLERRLDAIDAALSRPRNFYPFIGSVYPGGGVGVGPGYRVTLGDTSAFDAHGAYSYRSYKTVEATWKLPTFADDRIDVMLNAGWLDAPDVAFYGIGNDSPSVRRGFEFGRTTFGASARVHTVGNLAVGGGFAGIRIDSTPLALDGTLSAISPNYGRGSVFAEFDSRTSPGYTRRGGLYRVEFSDYRQTNGSAFSFQRVDADVRQFIPLRRESRIIALRALASTTSTSSGSEVPYALMPDLGGGHTLRGYSSWRFRDRNRLLLSGEYRWTAGSLVDMSLFLDAGKVAARADDLDQGSFTKSYGIGLSIHTPTSTMVRLELARTREGMSVGLSFGPSF